MIHLSVPAPHRPLTNLSVVPLPDSSLTRGRLQTQTATRSSATNRDSYPRLWENVDILVEGEPERVIDTGKWGGKVSMLVKWPPNSDAATRCFQEPFHPCLLGGAKASAHSVPRWSPENANTGHPVPCSFSHTSFLASFSRRPRYKVMYFCRPQ